jgi:predicted nucleic acid-binding protein
MTTTTRYLADSSAIVQLPRPEVAAVLGPLLTSGQLVTCGVVDLEVFGLVGDLDALAELRAARTLAFPWLATTDQDFHRALEVQALLAAERQEASWQTLVVAAVAERHRVVVLHCDNEFEQIAKATGQAVEWVGAEGSLR